MQRLARSARLCRTLRGRLTGSLGLGQQGPQRAHLDRFDQMSVEARSFGLTLVFSLPPARLGHQQHAGQMRHFADLPRDLVAVHARQTDIEQDRLRAEGLALGQSLGPIMGDAHLVPQSAEQSGQHAGRIVVVVHDQDP